MANIRETQLRLEYSLLRIAVRVAARFRIPMRTLSELMRLSYYEVLRREGFTQVDVARRLGQTDRYMRTTAQKLRSNFFANEREVGALRQVEELVARESPMPEDLLALLPAVAARDVEHAVTELLEEERIVRRENGRLQIGPRYELLTSDQFYRRIEALHQFLDGVYQAVMYRLVHDEKRTAMIKTITFNGKPDALEGFMARLESELRREVTKLEEQVQLDGAEGQPYTFGLTLAPCLHIGVVSDKARTGAKPFVQSTKRPRSTFQMT